MSDDYDGRIKLYERARAKWIESLHHELGGMILDAFRHGAKEPQIQSRFCATIMDAIDESLKRAYAELVKPPSIIADPTPLPVKVDLPKEAPKPVLPVKPVAPRPTGVL